MADSKRSFWGVLSLERLWQDVKYGCRTLVASPGFTIVAVLSLAIGIGANCAIFSFADALLLRPLPVARPGEVFTVGSMNSLEAFGASVLVASYPDYVDIRDRATSFEGLAAFRDITVGFAVDPTHSPKLKLGMLVSANLFSLMGVEPTIGRGFRPEENQVPGRDAVVVLGRRLWEEEFASDPAALGRRVRINGAELTVIGVAPSEFTGLDVVVRSDFYVPLMMSTRLTTDRRTGSLDQRDARYLKIKGRLRPGVTQAAAQAELTTIAADLERAYPDTNKNRRLAIQTELQSRMSADPPDATLIAMLSTLALAVLFVACANVAGLLTSRAPARAKEMALRLAIGAGRGRLVRQLVTESLLLAIAGGVAGLGVGYAGMMLFRQIEIPTDLPIALGFRLDQRALVFSLLVAVASAVLFGLVPAVQATRTDLTAVMKSGEGIGAGRRRRWGRPLLVGGQVAVSVVLLVIALFMYREFRHQLAQGPGYRTDHLVMMTLDPSLLRYTDAQSTQFFEQVAERARTVPGVKTVTMTSSVPMSNDIGGAAVIPEGYQFPVGRDVARVVSSNIDEFYFDAMGLTLVEGRTFRRTDDDGAPRVAIVNQVFAQHYWPDQDPIGKRFRLTINDKPWVQVVGLAKTSKYIFIAEPPTEFVYFPYRQRAQQQQQMVLLAESSGDAASLTAPLREVVRGLDPNMPIYNVRTMATLYRMRAVSVFNVLITTVAGMGLMGLGLAIVGLYGLVAYAVSRRTREIGIRMAIGADRAVVLRMVLRQGLVLAVVGLAVGLVASIGAGRILRAAFPSGNNDRDFAALLIVVPIVLGVTFLAAYLPARRASRVNPVQALRYE
ncbi:MAG TPA: ABC transporter permease [Vicinamibacterales bacterium]|nr:ABC transporter permease [Vicinamibacterales bacterium]